EVWIFGGQGTKSADLWRLTLHNLTWTWMAGSFLPNSGPVYAGVIHPGAMFGHAAWYNGADREMWLYGGYGQFGGFGSFSDLWKYSITSGQWTFVKGARTINSPGSYGTMGVEAESNLPPARQYLTFWFDDQNKDLWLFGGGGACSHLLP